MFLGAQRGIWDEYLHIMEVACLAVLASAAGLGIHAGVELAKYCACRAFRWVSAFVFRVPSSDQGIAMVNAFL